MHGMHDDMENGLVGAGLIAGFIIGLVIGFVLGWIIM